MRSLNVKNIIVSSKKLFLVSFNGDFVKEFVSLSNESKTLKEIHIIFPYFSLENSKEIAHISNESNYKNELQKLFESSNHINYLHAFKNINPHVQYVIYNALSAYNQNIIVAEFDNSLKAFVTIIPTDLNSFIEVNETQSIELKKYVDSLILISKNNENYQVLGDERENNLPEAFWDRQYKISMNNMEKAKNNNKAVLIEIASQHPLEKDGTPNSEFKARLDKGVEIYFKNRNNNIPTTLAVIGSIHIFNNNFDPCSLSTAGKNYLISRGVSEKDIEADDAINKYKGEEGVYNSMDECFVISKLFKDGNYSDLLSIVSPYQMYRKMLTYIANGLISQCIPVYVDNMFHNPIGEIMFNIQDVLYIDHDSQDRNKEAYINSREERKP